ncbi:MAG: helix-turn-helix domain-containing protein, partial [Terrimesophilobacter sp.]
MPETSEPAQSGRRRGRPGYDQQSVLEIAVAAFNEFGYDATSMGMLASRLALSKSAIYHHFASKEELLQVALDVALTGLEEILTHEQAQSGPAADRLDFILRGAVDVLVTRQPYVTLLLRLHGNTVVERTALARRRAFSGAVADLLLT